MPADGELTLGLYTRQGTLLRWIMQDEFRSAGDHRESWNGLDQWDHRIPPGDYILRGIYHAPLRAEYLMTLGNPGTPPWPTPDGRGDWLSDEGDPQAAATDGHWVFLGAPDSEKGFTLIGLDETGQRRWGTREPRHFYSRSVCLALSGNYLYALFSGPFRPDADASPYGGSGAHGRAVLICLDARTGQPVRFSRQNPPQEVATWPYREQPRRLWELRNSRSFSPATYGGQPRYACLDIGEPTNAIGLAAVGDKLYVSLLFDNKLIEIDAATGRPTGREFPLDQPAGLARWDDGTLLAVSGRKVVRIRLADGAVTPLVTAGLSAPDSLAVDRQRRIYVSDWGDSFQVKVFAANGHLLGAVGKPGGRPWVGPWDPDGMLVPRGIAVTDVGRLWVTEDDGTPPRISVWDAASGALVRDYLGPMPYGGGTYFWFDPHDPAEVHAEGTCYRIDVAHQSWTPQRIDFRRSGLDDPFTPNGHDLGPHPQVRVLFHAGHEYVAINTTSSMVSILQRQGDAYLPVAALGRTNANRQPALDGDGTERLVWDSDVGNRRYDGLFPDCFRGHKDETYCWTDANGDHLVQPEEMTWLPANTKSRPRWRQWTAIWGSDFSPDWSFFFAALTGDMQTIFRLDPRGWTAAGAPIYDLDAARPIIVDSQRHSINGLHVTDDAKLIVSYNFEAKSNPDAVAAYDLEGRKLWSVAMPRCFTGKALHANNALYDFTVAGLGDVVCAWLYHGSFRPHFFTSDGLYVGTVLRDSAQQRFMQEIGIPINLYVGTSLDDATTGPDALWSESSKYFYQAPDGTLELVNGGNQQAHLFRLHGFEPGAVGRFEGTYRLP